MTLTFKTKWAPIPVQRITKAIEAELMQELKNIAEEYKGRARNNLSQHKNLKDFSRGIVSKVGKGRNGLYAVIGMDRSKKVVRIPSRGPDKGKPVVKKATRFHGFVEYGTSRSRAFPHMRPALAEMGGEDNINRRLADAAKRGMGAI